jgi:alpha-L-rhamnosidase
MQEVLLGVVPALPVTGEPPTVLEISPAFGVLERASGTIPTVAGTAQLGWSRSGSGLDVDLSLPPNSLGKLSLPARSVSDVTVDSVSVEHANGVKLSSSEQGVVNLVIGGGRYSLHVSQG